MNNLCTNEVLIEEEYDNMPNLLATDAVEINDDSLRSSFANPDEVTKPNNRFFSTPVKLFTAGASALAAGSIASGVLAAIGIAAAITTPVGIALGAAAALAIFALIALAIKHYFANKAPVQAPTTVVTPA